MDYKAYFMEKFDISEIVPPDVYYALGDAAWHLFDSNLLHGAGYLRKRFGPAICNNWKSNGRFEWSGLRTPKAPKGIYSPTSQHTVNKDHLCSALDLKFANYTADQVRAEIKRDNNIPFITRIEDDVNWVHIDTKPSKESGVYFFKP